MRHDTAADLLRLLDDLHGQPRHDSRHVQPGALGRQQQPAAGKKLFTLRYMCLLIGSIVVVLYTYPELYHLVSPSVADANPTLPLFDGT